MLISKKKRFLGFCCRVRPSPAWLKMTGEHHHLTWRRRGEQEEPNHLFKRSDPEVDFRSFLTGQNLLTGFVRSPQTSPSFSDSLEVVTGPNRQSCSWPRFITGKTSVQYKVCIFTQFGHDPFLSETVGTLLRSEFPDVNQGPALQAGLSEDSSLRPAMLSFTAQIPTFGCNGSWGM